MIATNDEIYTATTPEVTELGFTPQEHGLFHQFHAHDWENDESFQAGLQTILSSNGTANSAEKDSILLKAKQFYFTRIIGHIDLDRYKLWEKYVVSAPSSDDNTSIKNTKFARFETYNFDKDDRFLAGLPDIIQQFINMQPPLDSERYQEEMTRVKANYFSKFVEPLDYTAYLSYVEEKKKATAPACPFAHLWQNKKKQTNDTNIESLSPTFLEIIPPTTSQGAQLLKMSSPYSQNLLTFDRLCDLSTAVQECFESIHVTSLILTGDSATTEDLTSDDNPIIYKDSRVFTSGLAIPQTIEKLKNMDKYHNIETCTKSIDLLLCAYYRMILNFRRLSVHHGKAVIMFVDGQVAPHTAHLLASAASIRVITENAVINSLYLPPPTETPWPYFPLSPLCKFNHLPVNAAKGMALYLALTPSQPLRGPDLLTLGLADFFVSSGKLDKVYESVVANCGVPLPHTVKAAHIVLNAEKVYAGPARVEVWRENIEKTFGVATSIEHLLMLLGAPETPSLFARPILSHIENHSPTLLKVIFTALRRAKEEQWTWEESLKMEYRIGTRWRRSEEFERWTEFAAKVKFGETGNALQRPSWYPSRLEDVGDDLVDGFFTPLSEDHDELDTWEQSEIDKAITFDLREEVDLDLLRENARRIFGIDNQNHQVKEESASETLYTCPVTGMIGPLPPGHRVSATI